MLQPTFFALKSAKTPFAADTLYKVGHQSAANAHFYKLCRLKCTFLRHTNYCTVILLHKMQYRAVIAARTGVFRAEICIEYNTLQHANELFYLQKMFPATEL